MADAEASKVRIEIHESEGFHTAAVDHAIVNQIFDGLGTTIKIYFTRLEATPISESFQGRFTEQGLQQTGPPEFETVLKRETEFAALMRPDHAFDLASAILTSLTRLNPEQRSRYKLPDDFVVVKRDPGPPAEKAPE